MHIHLPFLSNQTVHNFYENRGIDYAVANNDIPEKAEDLPLLFKQTLSSMGGDEYSV
ncbi:hypothetical protein SLEP1_g32948 [Rubroshorea leprosula]|uniref:Uncharacterized protein n=1 Tax=Rubroshorea leprosula TaxID=152421 RepID=A0AAV5KF20_9ROSI|nr:hypothetical protein SLEP1_g32948 [Rubroshorea leprosula]